MLTGSKLLFNSLKVDFGYPTIWLNLQTCWQLTKEDDSFYFSMLQSPKRHFFCICRWPVSECESACIFTQTNVSVKSCNDDQNLFENILRKLQIISLMSSEDSLSTQQGLAVQTIMRCHEWETKYAHCANWLLRSRSTKWEIRERPTLCVGCDLRPPLTTWWGHPFVKSAVFGIYLLFEFSPLLCKMDCSFHSMIWPPHYECERHIWNAPCLVINGMRRDTSTKIPWLELLQLPTSLMSCRAAGDIWV